LLFAWNPVNFRRDTNSSDDENREFYVHQHFDIEPDILVLGKGLGGGVIPQEDVLAKGGER